MPRPAPTEAEREFAAVVRRARDYIAGINQVRRATSDNAAAVARALEPFDPPQGLVSDIEEKLQARLDDLRTRQGRSAAQPATTTPSALSGSHAAHAVVMGDIVLKILDTIHPNNNATTRSRSDNARDLLPLISRFRETENSWPAARAQDLQTSVLLEFRNVYRIPGPGANNEQARSLLSEQIKLIRVVLNAMAEAAARVGGAGAARGGMAAAISVGIVVTVVAAFAGS